jgi:hypothetical protein
MGSMGYMVSVLSNGYTGREGWGFPFRRESNIRKLEHCVSVFSLRIDERKRTSGKGTDRRRRG